MRMEVAALVEPKYCEREIIRRVLAGAKDEFRVLVLAHQSRVFALIMRQVANQAIANELTQEVFLKAYRNLHRFRFEAQFSTWLIRIALNVCTTYFSSKRFKQAKSTMSFEEIEIPSESESYGVGAVIDRETLKRVRSALLTLSPKLRETIILCGFEERTYEEAAQILEIPVGTVRSRLNKARNLLRKKVFEA